MRKKLNVRRIFIATVGIGAAAHGAACGATSGNLMAIEFDSGSPHDSGVDARHDAAQDAGQPDAGDSGSASDSGDSG